MLAREEDNLENKWKRETAFLCSAEFKNNLPPNPMRWKLLNLSTRRDCVSLTGPDSLHAASSRQNAFSADLGVSVDPILLRSLKVCGGCPSILSQDAALLHEYTHTRSHATTHDNYNATTARRPDLSKALWLMNTQYISSMTLPEHLGRSEKDWAKHKYNSSFDLTRHNSRVAQAEAVAESFRIAQGLPVHEKDTDVHPDEVIPVLPAFDRRHGSHIHFTFDENPATDIECKEINSKDNPFGLVESSLVKPYSIDRASRTPEKFVSYMVPTFPYVDSPHSHKCAYQWRSEYQYRIANERDVKVDTVCLLFDTGTGEMRYVKLNSRLLLSRRSKHAKGTAARPMPRPSSVTVKRAPSDMADSPKHLKMNRR